MLSAKQSIFWGLLLLTTVSSSNVVGNNTTTSQGDDRLYFSTVIRKAKIVETSIDSQTELANITVQFNSGPNPPNSEYYFKCVPALEGCEVAAPNATVTGQLPTILGQVTATIVNLDFTPGLFYSCYIGAKVGKVTTCETVSSNSGPEGQYFYLAANGVTVLCPYAEVGRSGYVNGIKYTKVNEQTLRSMADNPFAWNRLPFVCTSGITDMSYLFTNTPNPVDRATYQKFNEDIRTWDTSSCTTMSFMFSNAYSFNSPITWWDVSNVEQMNGMFSLAGSFNQSLSLWNTERVITFSQMFFGASKFNSDIGSWNTSNALDFSHMFDHASIFNQNISQWDTSKARFMQYMFNYAFEFDQEIGTWNVGEVVDMNHMFAAASSFSRNLDSWDTSGVENMNAMFAYTDFNGALENWDTHNVKTMIQMFNFDGSFNRDISAWNVSKVTQMSWMFYGATSFNKDIRQWNTASVTGMEGMFMDSTFNQNLTQWDVANVVQCQGFAENGALNVTYYPRFSCVLGYCATGRTFMKLSPTIVYSKMDQAITSGNVVSVSLQSADVQNFCSPF